MFLSLFLAGCGTMPASGPYSSHMSQKNKVNIKISSIEGEEKEFNFAVAEIDLNLLSYVEEERKKYQASYDWPKSEPAEEITVNVGDTIQISIFESQSGGLFIPIDSSVRPGNFVSLPSQTINSTGLVTVPYAGEVQAAGKTTEEISELIVERLKDKAIEPQVVVSFGDRSGAEVSVIGDVNNARRLSLGFNQYKILDAIASAGGPTSPGYETKVSLQRDNEEFSIPFDQLVVDPDRNIYSQVSDILYLYREPQTFTSYGAVQSQGNIPFGKRNIQLSEALGLTRGLNDTQADPAEIYIYRQREYEYYTKSDIDPETSEAKFEKTTIPVIFKLDMRKPSGFFLAQKFAMEDQDIIYVANAQSVEFLKFLNILNSTAVTNNNTHSAVRDY